MRRLSFTLCALALGCAGDRPDEDPTGEVSGISIDSGITAGSGSGDESNDDADTMEKLDVAGGGTGMLPCPEGQECDECEIAMHTPCDDASTDMFMAIGLNCPGTPQVTGTLDGSNMALGLRTGFGPTPEWDPREGSKYAVLSSGFVVDLDIETPPGDLNLSPTHCNDDLGDEYDKGMALPAPVRTNNVGGDCSMDASLLGTGDCSNTIYDQFSQGVSANDYTEMRIVAQVPPTNNSIAYDLAFFSVEYPDYYGSQFNDMYIGWLESESWTGNISFDEMGNPISLNAGFLDFRDDANSLPEFAGTCMRQHAGTKWLTSIAPVTPGEQITLVFAIFDLSDSILDSYIFLDNFQWGCEGTDKPSTTPVG